MRRICSKTLNFCVTFLCKSDEIFEKIIGSGPAGMYTAKELLAQFPEGKVWIFEKGKEKFGLLKSGVAPDNLPIKAI